MIQVNTIQGDFLTGTPPKKLILARLGVSRPIYVNVDSPNLGFPNLNFKYNIKLLAATNSIDHKMLPCGRPAVVEAT